MHKHKAVKTVDRCFSGPVNNEERNEAADGNIVEIETCACGAERCTNVNGRHTEQGRWVTQEEMER